MRLSIKAKRNIGLIVVTAVIVVAIILIVYGVQRYENNAKTVYGHYGEVTETSQAYLDVTDRYFTDTYEGVSAVEGKRFLVVDVQVEAKKKLTLSSSKFSLNLAVNVVGGYESQDERWELTQAEQVLKKGQSQSIRIIFEVDENRHSDCYLSGYGANIDLCITA